MKIQGHNIPFYACSWFATQEPRVISGYILSARNAVERRHRLQWLAEGSLMYHMTGTTIEGKPITPQGCPVEKALFQGLLSYMSGITVK